MDVTIAGVRSCAHIAWHRWLRYGLVWVLGLLALIGCGGSATPASEPTEIAPIYAAIIRQIYTRDDTFGGTYRPQTVYVVAKADPPLLSEAVQRDITQQLHDLPVTLVWVTAMEDAPRNADGGVADHGAIITVGPIAQQSSRSMHVPASIYVAPLVAGGRTYVVEQNQAGIWHITGTTGEEWIS